MTMLKKISFVVCLFSIVFGQAQKLSEKEVSYFRMYEDSLNFLAKKIYSEKVDSIKFKLNKRFVDMWDDILSNDL